MDVRQIRDIVQRHDNLRENVRGVFARDQLPMNLPPGGYILNTDDSNGRGIHWIALWVLEDSMEFMDSFGHRPEYYGWSFTLPVLVNTKQIQSNDAITCGPFCMYFLYYRSLDLSMKTILDYFNADTQSNDLYVARFIKLL